MWTKERRGGHSRPSSGGTGGGWGFPRHSPPSPAGPPPSCLASREGGIIMTSHSRGKTRPKEEGSQGHGEADGGQSPRSGCPGGAHSSTQTENSSQVVGSAIGQAGAQGLSPRHTDSRGTWGGGVGGRDAVREQRCAPPPTFTVQQTALGSPRPFLLPQDGASFQASHQRRPTAPLAAAARMSPGPGRPTFLAVLGNPPPRAPHITCCTGQKKGPPQPQPAPPPASPALSA